MSPALDSPFRLRSDPAPTDLVAKYFRALGDPSRLRILGALSEADGELTVGELVERLELPQPKVSKHLGCLRWCGFVHDRREHRTVYYRLADARVEEILGLADALLADNAEHVAVCRTVDGAC